MVNAKSVKTLHRHQSIQNTQKRSNLSVFCFRYSFSRHVNSMQQSLDAGMSAVIFHVSAMVHFVVLINFAADFVSDDNAVAIVAVVLYIVVIAYVDELLVRLWRQNVPLSSQAPLTTVD